MISSLYKLDEDFPGQYQLTHSSLNLDARFKKNGKPANKFAGKSNERKKSR